jgi:hypothetical protein
MSCLGVLMSDSPDFSPLMETPFLDRFKGVNCSAKSHIRAMPGGRAGRYA